MFKAKDKDYKKQGQGLANLRPRTLSSLSSRCFDNESKFLRMHHCSFLNPYNT